ncbi:hypothetical protein GCM10022205_20140 [Spinactinospora alkalitolerans]
MHDPPYRAGWAAAMTGWNRGRPAARDPRDPRGDPAAAHRRTARARGGSARFAAARSSLLGARITGSGPGNRPRR